MSTYNGERFIEEQLNSIFHQTYQPLKLLIRDDGSTDNTRYLIKQYIKAHPEYSIHFIEGENLGVFKSFMDLVVKSDPKADYYAFADQDDYWLREKLLCGVERLRESDGQSHLYACPYTPVDVQLNKIREADANKRPDFYNGIVENIATGCTIVFDNYLKNLVLRSYPCEASIHDWWFYLIGCISGPVIYDSTSYILYRQHDSNVIGSKDGFISKWKSRWKRLSGWEKDIVKQGLIVQNKYADALNEKQKKDLEIFLNSSDFGFFKRIKYSISMPFFRQSKIDNLLLKTLVIFKKINNKNCP